MGETQTAIVDDGAVTVRVKCGPKPGQFAGAANPAWRGGQQAYECLECQAVVYRHPRRIEGRRIFCSKKCSGKYCREHGVFAEIKRQGWIDPERRARRLSGLRAAGRAKAEGQRVTVPCMWPACDQTMTRYRSQVGRSVIDETKTVRIAKHLQVCPTHRALIKNLVGPDVCMQGFGKVLLDPDRIYAARGSQPLALSVLVFELYQRNCGVCAKPLVFTERGRTWVFDHIVPVFQGGHTTRLNLMPLCNPCHRVKSTAETRGLHTGAKRTVMGYETHRHKDIRIAALLAENADLKRQLREIGNG